MKKKLCKAELFTSVKISTDARIDKNLRLLSVPKAFFVREHCTVKFGRAMNSKVRRM